MNSLAIFYTYAYLDPINPGRYKYGNYEFDFEPYYIGKGKDDRMYRHIRPAELRKDKNYLKTNKIKSILKLNIDIKKYIVKMFENLNEYEAMRREIDVIKNVGLKIDGVGPLTNLTYGGEIGNTKPLAIEIDMAIKKLKLDRSIYLNIVKDFYETRVSYVTLAKKYKLDDDSIKRIVLNKLLAFRYDAEFQKLFAKYKNVDVLNRGRYINGEIRFSFSKEQVIEIFRLFCKEHKGLTQIANIMKSKTSKIMQLLNGRSECVRRYYKNELKAAARERIKRKNIKDRNIKNVISLFNAGICIKDIMSRLKLPGRRVNTILHNNQNAWSNARKVSYAKYGFIYEKAARGNDGRFLKNNT